MNVFQKHIEIPSIRHNTTLIRNTTCSIRIKLLNFIENRTMKTDPWSKELFISQKISQRFKNPENRIKFHNYNAKVLRHYEANIDKPLKKNHRILLELLPPTKEKREEVFHKQYLLGKGISFSVHTHTEEYEGKNYPAIYKYIFITLDKDQIKIILK